MRSVPEWIGVTPDTRVPPRVQDRIFEKFDQRCQCGCTRPIATGEAWELDHIVALINGGENRESNLHPLLAAHHKTKTRSDVAIKSKSYRVRAKNIGVRKTRHPITGWRRFDGTPVRNPRLERA